MPVLTANTLRRLATEHEPVATVHPDLSVASVGALLASWRAGGPVLVTGPAPRSPGGGGGEGAGWVLRTAETYQDAHTLVPTSGTSGARKVVVLTKANIDAAVAASAARLATSASDTWLLVLPLYHVGGLSVLWRSLAAGGAVLLHDRFDAMRVAAALRSGEATVASLVPTMLQRALAADPGPYPPAKVLLGGAAASPALVERGLDAGLTVLPTYGLTEACSQVATVVPGEERASLGTAGPPLDGLEVTITAAGRIAVDGPQVSPGYVGEPPRTGPLVTGDRGRFDGGGRLVVGGRADDVIVTGGENVWPEHVEEVLRSHPGLEDVAVYGVPDQEWGERVEAAYVGDALAEELAAWARERLAPHELPKEWRAVSQIPRTPLGKVSRSALARQS